MLRAVVDSNVWISALLTSGGKSRELISYFENGLFTVIYPQSLIDELHKASKKPKLAARIHSDDFATLIALIERQGISTEPSVVRVISRDPSDDVILACAIAS